MAGQRQHVNWTSRFMLVYVLITTMLPLTVHANGVTAGVPQVTVPNVSVPNVHLPRIPANSIGDSANITGAGNSAEATAAATTTARQKQTEPAIQSVGPKEVLKKVTRMTIGGREVLYNAAVTMDDRNGVIRSGRRTAGAYALKTISPWIDLVAFEPLNVYVDTEGLLSQGKNIKKSYDTYKSIKDSANSTAVSSTVRGTAAQGAGAARVMGASFPILGGTAGMITGSMDIVESLSHQSQSNTAADTVKFYSGSASVLSGLGSVAGGVATIVAGAGIAPALAMVGTVLLIAGLLVGAAAIGLKYSPVFRNSRIGRGLTDFKQSFGQRN